MAGIHQFQVSHDQEQDRLLLRIRTTDSQELRFWLTRRFSGLLLKVLDQATNEDPDVAIQPEGPARSGVADFKRESALAEGDFGRPFEAGEPSPELGSAPVLLAQIRLERGKEGHHLLRLDPLQGHGIEIGLTATVAHSLTKLLADAAQTAEWGLAMEVAQPAVGQTLPRGARSH